MQSIQPANYFSYVELLKSSEHLVFFNRKQLNSITSENIFNSILNGMASTICSSHVVKNYVILEVRIVLFKLTVL